MAKPIVNVNGVLYTGEPRAKSVAAGSVVTITITNPGTTVRLELTDQSSFIPRTLPPIPDVTWTSTGTLISVTNGDTFNALKIGTYRLLVINDYTGSAVLDAPNTIEVLVYVQEPKYLQRIPAYKEYEDTSRGYAYISNITLEEIMAMVARGSAHIGYNSSGGVLSPGKAVYSSTSAVTINVALLDPVYNTDAFAKPLTVLGWELATATSLRRISHVGSVLGRLSTFANREDPSLSLDTPAGQLMVVITEGLAYNIDTSAGVSGDIAYVANAVGTWTFATPGILPVAATYKVPKGFVITSAADGVIALNAGDAQGIAFAAAPVIGSTDFIITVGDGVISTGMINANDPIYAGDAGACLTDAISRLGTGAPPPGQGKIFVGPGNYTASTSVDLGSIDIEFCDQSVWTVSAVLPYAFSIDTQGCVRNPKIIIANTVTDIFSLISAGIENAGTCIENAYISAGVGYGGTGSVIACNVAVGTIKGLIANNISVMGLTTHSLLGNLNTCSVQGVNISNVDGIIAGGYGISNLVNIISTPGVSGVHLSNISADFRNVLINITGAGIVQELTVENILANTGINLIKSDSTLLENIKFEDIVIKNTSITIGVLDHLVDISGASVKGLYFKDVYFYLNVDASPRLAGAVQIICPAISAGKDVIFENFNVLMLDSGTGNYGYFNDFTIELYYVTDYWFNSCFIPQANIVGALTRGVKLQYCTGNLERINWDFTCASDAPLILFYLSNIDYPATVLPNIYNNMKDSTIIINDGVNKGYAIIDGNVSNVFGNCHLWYRTSGTVENSLFVMMLNDGKNATFESIYTTTDFRNGYTVSALFNDVSNTIISNSYITDDFLNGYSNATWVTDLTASNCSISNSYVTDSVFIAYGDDDGTGTKTVDSSYFSISESHARSIFGGYGNLSNGDYCNISNNNIDSTISLPYLGTCANSIVDGNIVGGNVTIADVSAADPKHAEHINTFDNYIVGDFAIGAGTASKITGSIISNNYIGGTTISIATGAATATNYVSATSLEFSGNIAPLATITVGGTGSAGLLTNITGMSLSENVTNGLNLCLAGTTYITGNKLRISDNYMLFIKAFEATNSSFADTIFGNNLIEDNSTFYGADTSTVSKLILDGNTFLGITIGSGNASSANLTIDSVVLSNNIVSGTAYLALADDSAFGRCVLSKFVMSGNVLANTYIAVGRGSTVNGVLNANICTNLYLAPGSISATYITSIAGLVVEDIIASGNIYVAHADSTNADGLRLIGCNATNIYVGYGLGTHCQGISLIGCYATTIEFCSQGPSASESVDCSGSILANSIIGTDVFFAKGNGNATYYSTANNIQIIGNYIGRYLYVSYGECSYIKGAAISANYIGNNVYLAYSVSAGAIKNTFASATITNSILNGALYASYGADSANARAETSLIVGECSTKNIYIGNGDGSKSTAILSNSLIENVYIGYGSATANNSVETGYCVFNGNIISATKNLYIGYGNDNSITRYCKADDFVCDGNTFLNGSVYCAYGTGSSSDRNRIANNYIYDLIISVGNATVNKGTSANYAKIIGNHITHNFVTAYGTASGANVSDANRLLINSNYIGGSSIIAFADTSNSYRNMIENNDFVSILTVANGASSIAYKQVIIGNDVPAGITLATGAGAASNFCVIEGNVGDAVGTGDPAGTATADIIGNANSNYSTFIGNIGFRDIGGIGISNIDYSVFEGNIIDGTIVNTGVNCKIGADNIVF